MSDDSYDGGYSSSSKFHADELWLISYADLLTNLFVFFVLIISASTISRVKFERLKAAIQGKAIPQESISQIAKKIQSRVKEINKQDVIEVKDDLDSIAVQIKDKVLFDSGAYEIKSDSKAVLEEIIGILKNLPPYAHIAIEGYTDDNPVGKDRYQSNWHLSALRSLSVMNEFNKLNYCKENCEIRGFGEYRPFKPNRNAEGKAIEENQALNRRVVLRIF